MIKYFNHIVKGKIPHYLLRLYAAIDLCLPLEASSKIHNKGLEQNRSI
jgi:hypothetical protein